MSARIPAPVWVGTVALSALKQEGTVHILAICWEYCCFFRTLIGETVLSSSGVSGAVRRPILPLWHCTLCCTGKTRNKEEVDWLYGAWIYCFFSFTYCSQLWYYSAILLCQDGWLKLNILKCIYSGEKFCFFFWTTDKCLNSCDNPEGLSYKNK